VYCIEIMLGVSWDYQYEL